MFPMTDRQAYLDRYPIPLNEQQKQAVQAVDGPVLLLAVPGSGKTTVLVSRLGYMIWCCGIDPSSILTVTYTVAAAGDMKRRFESIFGAEAASKMTFRTINSISAGIIMKYGRMIGKAPFELESDDKKINALVSRLYMQYEGTYPTESDLKDIRTLISYIKNMMLDEKGIRKLETDVHLYEIYTNYCNEMKSQRKMDFDDQMVYAYRLLTSVPQLLAACRKQYSHICVDEAQDTSFIQHKIIELLAGENDNLFMVGDEDQSIYGFRAAYPEALIDFEKNHPGAKVLYLENNFRSDGYIVAAADRFIRNNTMRHPKTMTAVRPAQCSIRTIPVKRRSLQYAYLFKTLPEVNVQTAVLYRNNESAIPLIDMLERNGTPYQTRNMEMSFFTSRQVMDITNIMKFAMDMKNTELFEQIYFKMNMFLSKKDALAICHIAKKEKISVCSAVFHKKGMAPYVYDGVKNAEKKLKALLMMAPDQAISSIMDGLGYDAYMERCGIPDGKISILRMLARQETTVQGFLRRLDELKTLIAEHVNDRNVPVILSTVHASKGLEYDNVYVLDALDGIFPERVPRDLKGMTKEEKSVYEEERRLFYVACTRAKNVLNLFFLEGESSFVSQFVDPPKAEKKGNEKKDQNFEAWKSKVRKAKKVRHSVYGIGTVRKVSAHNINIDFGDKIKDFKLFNLYINDLLTIVKQ